MNEKLKTFLLGIAAGAAIGLGGLLYTLLNAAGLKYLGSLLFSVGLLLVCFLGLFLYTGKIGFLFEQKDKTGYCVSLSLGYLGNLIGALLFGLLCMIVFSSSQPIMTSIASIASKRLSDIGNGGTPLWQSLLTGFFCGALVHTGVFFFKKKDINLALRVVILVACVFVFVALGFEHCIANMFYLSMGGAWCLSSIVNVLIVTISNSLGAFTIALLISGIRKKLNR